MLPWQLAEIQSVLYFISGNVYFISSNKNVFLVILILVSVLVNNTMVSDGSAWYWMINMVYTVGLIIVHRKIPW